FCPQKIHSGRRTYQSSVLGKQLERTKEPTMRTASFIRRMIITLSFALLLIPAASNAQVLFSGQACTAGNGLYSCDFKDETGTQIFTASITLRVGQLIPTSLIP